MAFSDISEFWKIIKRTRITILGVGNVKCDRYSGVTTNIVATRAISSNMKALIANVGINVTYQVYQNVTSEILSTAGEKEISTKIATPLLRKLTEMLDLQYMHLSTGLVNNISVDRQGNT